MKKARAMIRELDQRFGKEKLERSKMNYLIGGDPGGGQGGTDPWPGDGG